MSEVEAITRLHSESRRELYQSLGMLQGILDGAIKDGCARCEEGLVIIDEIIELIEFYTRREENKMSVKVDGDEVGLPIEEWADIEADMPELDPEAVTYFKEALSRISRVKK